MGAQGVVGKAGKAAGSEAVQEGGSDEDCTHQGATVNL